MKKHLNKLLLLSLLVLTGCGDTTTTSSLETTTKDTLTTTQTNLDSSSITSSKAEINKDEVLLNKLHSELSMSFTLTIETVNKETDEAINPETFNTITYIGENEYLNEEYDSNNNLTNTCHRFKDSEGYSVIKEINVDNTQIIEEREMNYETFEDQVYDEKYKNPFLNISIDDFNKERLNEYTLNLTNFDKTYLQTIFTQYYGELNSLVFLVGDNQNINFSFISNYDPGDYSSTYYRYTANGSLLNKEDIDIPEIKLFEKSEASNILKEKINILKKQEYQFTYTIIDPDDNNISEVYEVIVNKEIYLITHTEDNITSQYGALDTENGLVEFDVLKENDLVKFLARSNPIPGRNVINTLNDFKMASEFFYLDNNSYKIHQGLNLSKHLSHFLPSTFIRDDSNSIDEKSFIMNIENDSIEINYDYSYATWHMNLTIDKLQGAVIPYQDYEIIYPTIPQSWSEMDFYQDLVSLLGNEERVNELPFIYPDLGWDITTIFPDFGFATLMGTYSTAELASDEQFNYTMDLMMAGFMIGDDLESYEKAYDDCTVVVSTAVDECDFNLYIDII